MVAFIEILYIAAVKWETCLNLLESNKTVSFSSYWDRIFECLLSYFWTVLAEDFMKNQILWKIE